MIKKIIPPVIVGVMSAVAVTITFQQGLQTWVLFMGWVSFFLFGKSPKQMLLTFTQIMLGICTAISMLLGGQFLSNIIGGVGIGVAIVLVMTVFMYVVPTLKSINVVPAYFMGIITFFGTQPKLNVVEISTIVGTLVLGFAFAWITENINLRLVK